MFYKLILRYVLKNPVMMMHAGCLVAFTVQMVILASNQINSSLGGEEIGQHCVPGVIQDLYQTSIQYSIAEIHKEGY